MGQIKTSSAVLIAVQLSSQTEREVQASLDELERLVSTLGYQAVTRIVQKRSSEKSPTFLGEGKLEELAQWTGGKGKVSGFVAKKSKAALKREQEEMSDEEPETKSTGKSTASKTADLVVADSDLSPSQLRNLETAAGVPVLDRTGVIIEIFGRHARTRAARLQVEIAKLTYMAPRLREIGGTKERQGGGVGGRGAGESALELDKRKVRDRIKELKDELASVGDEHTIRRSRRKEENTVAIVGYTNAGKSSLMKAMTGSKVLVADKLFATLDTTIRPLYPETTPKILLSDTVGFIKKLPHALVASFKSTLDEALSASLILHVIDAADPSFRAQMEVTEKVLGEVNAKEIPTLRIFNKKDLLSGNEIQKLQKEFPEAVFISAHNEKNLKDLRNQILEHFESDMIEGEIFVAYSSKGLIGEIRSRMRVLGEKHDEKGTLFRVRANAEDLKRLARKNQG